MQRYAKLVNNIVDLLTEAETQPAGWIAATNASAGDIYDPVTQTFSHPGPTPDPRQPIITKRAFIARFPASSDPYVNKFSLLSMFLQKDSYAESLQPDATSRFTLQSRIVSGLDFLNASSNVNLTMADAANFTGLLLDSSIPTPFRLTVAERNSILSTTILDSERPS